jgi:homoserine dehydrogenase
VNGTTNYILSAMAADGRPYDEVLRDAQEQGFAEADPSGDVEGDYAANKLVILARLAFGVWLDPPTIGRRPPTVGGLGPAGITGVSDVALRDAADMGLAIRLLAIAERGESGIEAGVLPTAVPADGPFGRTTGVTNRIEIDAEPLGTVGLSGPGAGGAATSSAVLGDLVAIARGQGSTWAGLAAAEGPVAALDPLDVSRAWLMAGDGSPARRTEPMSLDDARRTAGSTTTTGADAAIYPIHG